DAIQEYHRFDGYVRQRFSNLYDSGASDDSGAFESHFYHIIQEKRDERMISNMELAAANNISYEQLKELGWYDHHVMLEKTRASSRQNGTPTDAIWD
ncbi:MAG: hypothetical protein QQN63_11665, partial [Nitrosopumilus sp.]